MKVGHLEVDEAAIAAFCEKHKIAEFSIFGSALRQDFHADSDVDVLFELSAGEENSVEKYLEMKDELESMFGRRVDIVRKVNIRNPFMRHEILTTRHKVYVNSAA